jgi:hypothetical protein
MKTTSTTPTTHNAHNALTFYHGTDGASDSTPSGIQGVMGAHARTRRGGGPSRSGGHLSYTPPATSFTRSAHHARRRTALQVDGLLALHQTRVLLCESLSALDGLAYEIHPLLFLFGVFRSQIHRVTRRLT